MHRSRRRIGDIVAPVIEAGPDHLPDAVLVVHGNPGSSEEWADLVERVGETTRAIATDMPGFGGADKPETFDHTVAGYARHLEDLLDTFGLQRVHLVLHDLGGPWGLRFARDHPERVASVVLINAGGMPGYRWHLLARIWRTPRLGELVMRSGRPAVFRFLLRLGNPIPIPDRHVETMIANFDTATREAVLRIYRATDESEFDAIADDLARADLPALVVWGETDPFVTLADAQAFRRVFPQARFVKIPDSGHWPHLTTPEVVEEAVVSWVGAAATP